MGTDNATDLTEGKQRSLKNLKPFVKGESGNPNGRPKGTYSLVTMLKNKLEEAPAGNKKTYGELLVDRLLKEAIAEGDTQMIRTILSYVDGMPTQRTELTGKDGKDLSIELIKYDPKDKDSV